MSYSCICSIFDYLDFLAAADIRDIAFIGIEVHLETEPLIHPNNDIFEHYSGWSPDPQLYLVAILETEMPGLAGIHVNMPHGPETPLFELYHPFRADNGYGGGTLYIPGQPYRCIDAEKDGIGFGQFNLCSFPRRSEDSDTFEEPCLGTDKPDRLLRRKGPRLVEFPHRVQFGAGAEKLLDVFFGQMDMTDRNTDRYLLLIDGKPFRLPSVSRRCFPRCVFEAQAFENLSYDSIQHILIDR